MMKSYNCSNNIPKYKILVKLDPSISKSRREYVANGIRAYYRDDLTKLVDINIGFEAIESITTLFQYFVYLVGTIALILAFFLLKISFYVA